MAAYDPQVPWVRDQNALWRDLAGATITGWEGYDYHVGADDDELTFLDQSDPFRQLSALRMRLSDGTAIDFGTYQNDTEFGLELHRGDSVVWRDDGYSRPSDLSDLPVGLVERLEIHLDDYPWTDFDLIEVLLTVAGRPVLVVAAEVRPDRDGARFCWSDESFFVFADPANADAVDWRGVRRFVTREISSGPHGGDVFTGLGRSITRVTTTKILETQYPIVCWRAGYDIDESQDLLERILETLLYHEYGRVEGAATSPMTAEELRGIALRATRFRAGFGQPEVDAMIRDVAATLEEYERR